MPKHSTLKISTTPDGNTTVSTVDPEAPTLAESDHEQASALVRFLARTTGRNPCELLGYLTAAMIGPTERPPGWVERRLLQKGLDAVAQSFLGQTLEICQRHLQAAFLTDGPVVPDPNDREECVSFARGFLEAASLDELWREDEIAWSYAAWAAILCDRPDLVADGLPILDLTFDEDQDQDDDEDEEEEAWTADTREAEPVHDKQAACEAMAEHIVEARICFDFVRAVTAPTEIEKNASCPCDSGQAVGSCCVARATRGTVN